MTATLCARHPALRGRLPVVRLGRWPTAVERFAPLDARLGLELWIKRDDHSGLPYGGNKVRKLELLLGEAEALGAREVLTVGGIGSNHIVATACYARQLGLRPLAVVVPQPVTAAVHANVSLMQQLGVSLIPCPARPLVPLTLAAARRGGRHVIGPGGSSPLGTVGHVDAALELAAQIRAGLLPEPAALYVPLGSGGTVAGLALGCAMAGLATRIVAVRVVERLLVNATLVRLLVRRTAALLRRLGARGLPRVVDNLELVHDQFGGRYGRPTPAAERAVALAAEHGGVALETTYSAKALAALIAHAPRLAADGAPVLFWNTYNGQDTAALLEPAGPEELPPAVQRWLRRG